MLVVTRFLLFDSELMGASIVCESAIRRITGGALLLQCLLVQLTVANVKEV